MCEIVKWRVLIVAAALMLFLFPIASARASTTVVTFDDLVGSGIVPNSYGGINWNGNWYYYGFSQPPYNPESSPNRVYDLSNNTNSFDFLTPEVFDGAYFSGYPSAAVTFDLYNGATLVWVSGSLAPSSTPTFLSSGYSGLVTSVSVESLIPDLFVMDNVTYETSSIASTPEPASFVLFGTGLLAMGGIVRRRLAGKFRFVA